MTSAITRMGDNSFAAACFNDCTIADLEAALAGPVDTADCEAWDITAEQWREQIELALEAKREANT